MLRAFTCCALILLTACNPAAIRDSNLRSAAREAAETRFAAECGTVTVPDRAFLPIDITGDGQDSYVLSFARVGCEKIPALWATPGNSLFQVWTNAGGNPRLVLEQPMAGFRHDYKTAMLITDQQGRSCPAGSGVETCRVVYRWDRTARALIIVERHLRPAEPLPVSGIVAARAGNHGFAGSP